MLVITLCHSSRTYGGYEAMHICKNIYSSRSGMYRTKKILTSRLPRYQDTNVIRPASDAVSNDPT